MEKNKNEHKKFNTLDEVLSKKDDKSNQIYIFCKKCVHFKNK